MVEVVFRELYQHGRIEVWRAVADSLKNPYVYKPQIFLKSGGQEELFPQPYNLSGAILVARGAVENWKLGRAVRIG